jgi:hypothetical protein
MKAMDKKSSVSHRVSRHGLLYIARSPVMHVQHKQIGQILRNNTIKAKLAIGEPNDKYEQEADRVADEVMRMPEPNVQRQPEPEEEEEEPVQAKSKAGDIPAVTPVIESRINSLKGNGQPLDSSTRAFFEPRFGHDFSHVRVHADSTAADTAKSINASAFTLGNHVAMGSGEYHPHSQSGQRLLGHELTHVIQQGESSRLTSKAQHQVLIESDPVYAAVAPKTSVQREEVASRIPKPLPGGLSQQQWTKLKAVHDKRRQALQTAVISGDVAGMKSAGKAAARLFGVTLQRPVPDYKKFFIMVWLTEDPDEPLGWSMARLILYKRLKSELERKVPAQALDEVVSRLVSSYKSHYANLLKATMLINKLARFPELFRTNFKNVIHVFKDENLNGPIFSNWQRARLSEFFHDNKIPEGLFTSSYATGNIKPHQRILMAAQILAVGERDLKARKGLKVRGDQWDLEPHVKARYCGHWVKLAWNYAGVNPGGNNSREWVVGPTGRISFGGGGKRTGKIGKRLYGLWRYRGHLRGYNLALITAVYDSGPVLRGALLRIGKGLVEDVVKRTLEWRKQADQAYDVARAAFTKIKRSRRNKTWYRIKYASSKVYKERQQARRLAKTAKRDRKKFTDLVLSGPKVSRYVKRLGLTVLGKLANKGQFKSLYEKLSPAVHAKITKNWRRRQGMGFNMFKHIKAGDHLAYYVANASTTGGHSVIFVKWKDQTTQDGVNEKGRVVYYRRAYIYNQYRNRPPPSGGVYGSWYLGFPYTNVLFTKGKRITSNIFEKGKRITGRVSPVNAYFRPKKSRRGDVGPPRTQQQLLHFDRHKANLANLSKLKRMTQGRRAQKIDLVKLAKFLRAKASEFLRDPNLATLEPAQRKLCQQIIQAQSGATIDNISILVALCQKLLNPIKYAQKMRAKTHKVNGKLNWSQLGLKTRVQREALEPGLGGAHSWLALICKQDLGRYFKLDLAIEYNRTYMDRNDIPPGKLTKLVEQVASNVAKQLSRPPRRVRGDPVKLMLLKRYHQQHRSGTKGLASLSILIGLWQVLRGRTADGWVSRYSRFFTAAQWKEFNSKGKVK